ncbi:MAG: phosphoribosylamine--glycine ligase [bacterium P3]|nr:MAG: phosphoribosylamine--glycine ligase [bacterium P3]KWW40024.1 MAG: phosphoribosylamine--glycine ligase [bacterium F083]
MMNILLLGSGGREHAIARKIVQSSRCDRLYIAPGNAGTAECGTNVQLDPMDFNAVADFVLQQRVEMLVVGPEAPLVDGIADHFADHDALRHVKVIGPKRQGAMLEGSKDYAKAFMSRHAIPTARYRTFTRETVADGYAFLDSLQAPYVLKADGLAAGKGVLIEPGLETAKAHLEEMLGGKFGAASTSVVIEEYLSGIELSVFVLTDGEHYLMLPEAKDYKRIGEGDTGLNTGGMGSVSPVPFADSAFMRKVEERIVRPTVQGLRDEHIDYRGFIFVGLMCCNGDPYVIEYNVRMGDPETESVFPRIKSDVVELFEHTALGSLDRCTLEVDRRAAACVMMVAGGYPESYAKGAAIDLGAGSDDVQLFHCGTVRADDGTLRTNGGRVICTTALSDTLESALRQSYRRAEAIGWQDKYMRRDIGQDLLRLL